MDYGLATFVCIIALSVNAEMEPLVLRRCNTYSQFTLVDRRALIKDSSGNEDVSGANRRSRFGGRFEERPEIQRRPYSLILRWS